MKQNNENTNAFLIHISAFAEFLFPFGNIITPLIAWQTLKNRSQYLDEKGKEAKLAEESKEKEESVETEEQKEDPNVDSKSEEVEEGKET